MVQAPSKPLSLEEFLQQPETKPASEYIGGRVVQKPMPGAAHSVIQGELTTAINAALRPSKVARAFLELNCTFGDNSVVPDIAVLPWQDIPRQQDGMLGGDFLIAPAWMIEILSPRQSQTIVTMKILRCLENGTQMGWLIDPAMKCVFSYTPDSAPVSHVEADQVLPVPSFASEFSLTLGELINWLYE